MIAAYAGRPSVRAGGTLTLHVSSDRACTLRFVRVGSVPQTMRAHRGTPISRNPVHTGRAGERWEWPAYAFTIPDDWPSGVYMAVFDRGAGVPQRVDARDARALFVVRPRERSSNMLYNVPVFTYHAYNVGADTASDGTCLYNDARAVTLARPGGGNGGHLWDEGILDVYDPETPRQTFAHWDMHAIRWLERRHGAVDYACDLDLHDDPHALEGYRLLLAFGHHEYWTDAMRDAVRRHVRGGGNAAFFTGNTCWFRIRYDEPSMSISRIGRWIDDPEERTFGVSYRFGGGKWRAGRPPTGYTVASERHWIFDDSGLRNGDVFGDEERLIGYECDGSPDEPSANFEVLAHGCLKNWPVHDGSGEINAGRANIGISHERGSLFVAGTVDWARVLASGEPVVDRITHNVIRRLSAS